MSGPETRRRPMEQTTDRFVNDPDFREQMRQDPEGTAERLTQSSGLQLAEEDRQALRTIDRSPPDEQLTERASKAAAYCAKR